MKHGTVNAPGIMRLFLSMLLVGLLLAAYGIYLLYFTSIIEQQGIHGIALVTGLIVLGLLLLIPAKIYIILRFTRDKAKPRS